MNWRRKLLVGIAALAVVAGAFACGAWVGADFTGKIYGAHALPRASANANLLHRKLLLIEKGDVGALRDEINMELDGELIALCVLMKEPAGSSHEDATRARTILRRIAQYRRDAPPTYPAAYAAAEEPANMLRECLQAALVAGE